MTIYLAADHAGHELKEKVKEFLTDSNYQVEDCGAFDFNKDDDYPDFVRKAAEAVANDPEHSRAILFGGGGQGEAMVANRFKGVRAAVYYGPRSAVSAVDVSGRKSVDSLEGIKLAREHNDANALSLAARFLTEPEAIEAVKLWLETPFSGEERHKRRLDKF
ncbi:MAG: RpiB/LacA/LacB family sugar-phosphate isomerase [bacterium]|nr:RpiB/LacA/LacB family sugar-phosphate isomerase [bacterium]